MSHFPRFSIWFNLAFRVLMVLGLLLAGFPLSHASASQNQEPGPSAHRVLEMITWLNKEKPFQTTRIYDRNGQLLAVIDDQGLRTIVGLDDIPEFLVQATLATEDRRFYSHNGVDYKAIARAAWQNSQAEQIVSGGSTITQQLSRLLFLPPPQRYEQTMTRKWREAQYAVQLERLYSKDEILAMYLNMVYYGHHAYGVAAAAEAYFNKPLSELTPAEMAVIAGLPQSPVQYDPLLNPEAAMRRQRVVLSLMEEAGYLTAAEVAEIKAQPVHFQAFQRPENLAPHFVDYIRSILIERYGTEGVHWGLQVHTSLDLRYQRLAERIARAQVKDKGEKYHFNNAAVVMMYPPTGEILAMVGSVDYNSEEIDGQVNMAIEPRQPGSSIKPVLYAAAFDRGWSPASVIWDLPVSYVLNGVARYRPTNITKRFYGPLRLRMSLSNSLNVPAVKLLVQVGIPAMLETARALGIEYWRKPVKDYGLSLSVGGYEVPLVELTHAFATIAHEGVYTPLHPITLIEDGAGNVVYEMDPVDEQRRAISPVAAYQLASVLSDSRARRTMFPRPSPLDTSRIAAAKTGTTDGWRDNLTVGFTPYLTVGVWTGNSNSRPMRNAIGLYTAGPIWHDIMEAVWANPSLYDALGYANASLPWGFKQPPDVRTVPVCDWPIGKFTLACPRMVEEVYPADAPTTIPSGRTTGYCLPAGVEDAPAEAYFLSLPERDTEMVTAHNWMRKRFARPVQELTDCDTTPRPRELVKPLPLLPPRQLVKLDDENGATATTKAPGTSSGE